MTPIQNRFVLTHSRDFGVIRYVLHQRDISLKKVKESLPGLLAILMLIRMAFFILCSPASYTCCRMLYTRIYVRR